MHLLPDGVPPARAVLAANLETAINGVWDARAARRRSRRRRRRRRGRLPGRMARGARSSGCDVELVDVNPRASRSRARSASASPLPGRAAAGADLVIHASGSPAGLALALELAGVRGDGARDELVRRCQRVALPLGEAFHARRLTLKSSQVGHVAGAAARALDDRRGRMQLALSLLDDAALDVLITGESAFDELPA